MTNQSVKPGEIRLDLIPLDWPLTPLGGNKDPYIQGWQNKPFSVKEIEEELATGDCKAIGVLGGPAYNHPYGLVWVERLMDQAYTPLSKRSVSYPFKTRCLPPLPSSAVKSAANGNSTK